MRNGQLYGLIWLDKNGYEPTTVNWSEFSRACHSDSSWWESCYHSLLQGTRLETGSLKFKNNVKGFCRRGLWKSQRAALGAPFWCGFITYWPLACILFCHKCQVCLPGRQPCHFVISASEAKCCSYGLNVSSGCSKVFQKANKNPLNFL